MFLQFINRNINSMRVIIIAIVIVIWITHWSIEETHCLCCLIRDIRKSEENALRAHQFPEKAMRTRIAMTYRHQKKETHTNVHNEHSISGIVKELVFFYFCVFSVCEWFCFQIINNIPSFNCTLYFTFVMY